MKEIFEYVTRLLPQSLVVAAILVAGVFFAVYWYNAYRSYSDALSDNRFQTISVIIVAVALLYFFNSPNIPRAASRKPVLLVPQFTNDNDDTYRKPFVMELSTRLDATLNRTGTVEAIRGFVRDRETATKIIESYGASAILFDTFVSHPGDQHIYCMRFLANGSQEVACFPPFQMIDTGRNADSIVMRIAGHLAANDQVGTNPLIKRVAQLETQLNRLENVAQAEQFQLRSKAVPVYRRRYALLVAVDNVMPRAQARPSLLFCKSDARTLADVLCSTYGFDPQDTQLLFDAKATQNGILGAIHSLSVAANPDDLFVFYFAGYGMTTGARDSTGAITKYDAAIATYDFDIKSPFLIRELLEAIDAVKARHKAVVLDATDATVGLVGDMAFQRSKSSNDSVVTVLAASGPGQVAAEGLEGGVFSHAFIHALKRGGHTIGEPNWLPEIYARLRASMAASGAAQVPQMITISGCGDIAFVPVAR